MLTRWPRYGAWRACLLAFPILVLPGCADDPSQSAAEDTAKEMAAKATAAAATEAAPAGTAEQTYNPIGKRDPFRSYLAELALAELGATPKRKTEPTESFELEQYRLTGLLTGTSQPKAMVEDPSGKGHVVKEGTHIGKNGAIITRITSVGIVVTQELRSPTGEKIHVPLEIKLPQPELELGVDQ